MAEQAITARVPRKTCELIDWITAEEGLDRSTVIRKLLGLGLTEWRSQAALRRYQKGEVTLLRAAEIAGVSIYEMMAIIKDRGVPYRYDLSDLEEYVGKQHG